MPAFPVIEFEQYDSGSQEDRLLMFAAPATTIAKWAGIPRKGWHVRILYQRWITPGRENQLKSFWEAASTRNDQQPTPYILGPTALIIAIHDEPVINDGKIVLEYELPFSAADPPISKLKMVAEKVVPRLKDRLDPGQIELLESFSQQPYQELPDTGHDYVLESVLQIQQMASAAEWFVEKNNIGDRELDEMIEALESLCRPALVVDGQHRLFGAAISDNRVNLPVVAMPNCPWSEQIYQFVVINETARSVETSLLTDIFGSSLTNNEQGLLREQFARSNVYIEERIAAVVAARDERSPFYNMVLIKLSGSQPDGKPYIPETTIRYLIEGGRSARSWRTDDEFYEKFISRSFSERVDWESWTEGAWLGYWWSFWSTVRDFYNVQAKREIRDDDFELWSKTEMSNLTKSVTLRLLQTLFIEFAVEQIEDIERLRKPLVEALGEKEAEKKIEAMVNQASIPTDLDEFPNYVREKFLETGIPVRVFLKPWKASLDDASGIADLKEELSRAFRLTQDGKRYHARNTAVFSIADSD